MVVDEIRSSGGRAVAVTADVGDAGQLPGLIDRTVEELGGIDVLVNNAGGGMSPPFVDTPDRAPRRRFPPRRRRALRGARLALPHLLERDGASIINMASLGARKAARGHLAHHVAKAALAHMTRMMAADLGPKVRVNALLPGPVETPAFGQVLEHRPELRDLLVGRTRMRRIGIPEDVAYAAVYLASPAASWVTGVLLDVNGGEVDEMAATPDL